MLIFTAVLIVMGEFFDSLIKDSVVCAEANLAKIAYIDSQCLSEACFFFAPDTVQPNSDSRVTTPVPFNRMYKIVPPSLTSQLTTIFKFPGVLKLRFATRKSFSISLGNY